MAGVRPGENQVALRVHACVRIQKSRYVLEPTENNEENKEDLPKQLRFLLL